MAISNIKTSKLYFELFRTFFILTLLRISGGNARIISEHSDQHTNPVDSNEVVLQKYAVVGSITDLPCDLNVGSGDKIRLVLWSKNSTVIYSLDARDKVLNEGQHWSNEQAIGGRAFFKIKTGDQDEMPSLIIENVKESDAGLYKCRLDFKKSPTLYQSINLTVIVPPQKLVIKDERGQDLTHIIGPYNEGSSLRLTCISTGWPTPKVSWFKENELLDDSWEISPETFSSSVVSNTITIPRLQRYDLHSKLTCQSSNYNNSMPLSTTVSLDLSFRPLDVKLIEPKTALSADKEYQLQCQSSGSRPPAVITFYHGSARLKNHKEITSHDGNLTTSYLTFVPVIEDSGKFLSCRAENPIIPGSAIEDGWKMEIHYIPQLQLELGSTLNSSQIKEQDDVYFECRVKANPPITSLKWQHNGRNLHHNASAGIIISNQSLVLQGITRKSGGLYTCIGTNREGDGVSAPVNLNVKYAPVCRTNQQTVYGIARQESAKINCEVDSNPEADLNFRWKFNNSAETIDITQSHFRNDRSRSTLTYKPMTELDYGTVLCWASNDLIGVQKVPCVYHIIPAGKPDAVTNCSILNQTFDSLMVSCTEGFNGGIQQTFVVEILDFQTHFLIRNLTNSRPVFNVRNLDPGASFVVRIYAANSKGRSETQVLSASTLKAAEKQTGISAASSIKPVFLQMTPIFAVLIGVVVTIILIAVVIVIILRGRGHTGEDKRHPKKKNVNGLKPIPNSNDHSDNSSIPLKKSIDDLIDPDDKNPDVIPHAPEVDGIDPDGEKVFLERLNNSSRFYETIPRAVRNRPSGEPGTPSSQDNLVSSNSKIGRHQQNLISPHLVRLQTFDSGQGEVTYAELSLPNSPAYHQQPNTSSILRNPNCHSRIQEPIIYAQIDPAKSGQPGQVHNVVEQQTQTVGSHYPPLSPPSTEVDSSSCYNARTPLLQSMSLSDPNRESTVIVGEEYIRIRPENAHAIYKNGSNLRF